MGKRYTYLYRLIAIMILFLFVPTILVVDIFWKSSFREIEQSKEVYYQKMTDTFMNIFDEKILELKNQAISIVAQSKDPNSTFWGGYEKFFENNYWYNEAVKEIVEKYSNHNVSECGVYYYESDKIIFEYGTLSSLQYIEDYLMIDDKTAEIRNFFSEDKYEMMELIFATSITSKEYQGSLLVGYCTMLGKAQDKVMIFYRIEPKDFENIISMLYGNTGIHLYLLNKENNQVLLEFGENAQEIRNIEWEDNCLQKAEHHQKVVYSNTSNLFPLSYVLYITNDALQNNVIIFYQDMKFLLIIVTFTLFVISLISIYVVYKPVYQLTVDLEYYSGGELEIIRNALDDRYLKIQEQEMLIMDLLLNHLIYGVPISEERMVCLGIKSDIRYYCVLVLEGYVLLTQEAEDLSSEIEKKFGVRLFITDWQGKNSSLLILFLKQSSMTELELVMRNWLDNKLMMEWTLYLGKVVDTLDDIRSSFLSCFENNEEACDMKKKVKKNMILEYLELHYRDIDLSQTKVADAFQISNYTLSRMFKNQVGIGFSEYVNGKRLELAKELLLTTTYSVREISVMVGFENDNYFSRLFKAMVGVSPTSFRGQ